MWHRVTGAIGCNAQLSPFYVFLTVENALYAIALHTKCTLYRLFDDWLSQFYCYNRTDNKFKSLPRSKIVSYHAAFMYLFTALHTSTHFLKILTLRRAGIWRNCLKITIIYVHATMYNHFPNQPRFDFAVSPEPAVQFRKKIIVKWSTHQLYTWRSANVLRFFFPFM